MDPIVIAAIVLVVVLLAGALVVRSRRTRHSSREGASNVFI